MQNLIVAVLLLEHHIQLMCSLLQFDDAYAASLSDPTVAIRGPVLLVFWASVLASIEDISDVPGRYTSTRMSYRRSRCFGIKDKQNLIASVVRGRVPTLFSSLAHSLLRNERSDCETKRCQEL